MKKLFIFDFDGTAVDTITDVGICFNEALRLHGFPQHPLENIGSMVGGNLETVVSRMLPQDQITTDNIDAVKTTYRKLYLESSKPNTAPYPGMRALLDELKASGAKLAVNSNKGQALLDDMVEKLFPSGYFDSVIGYLETRPSKPDPHGVAMILAACGCAREEAVYIGDGKSDIDTAVNAGIPCVFVTWGQGSAEDRRNPAIAHAVDTAEQLRDVLFLEKL